MTVADVAPETRALDAVRARCARLLAEVRRNPGCGVRALRLAVGGKAQALDEALGLLVEEGRIRFERGEKNAKRYFAEREPGEDDD